MCGIFFLCSSSSKNCDFNLIELNKRRGPDATSEINTFKFNYHLKFIGNVLSLRGVQTVKQPIVKADNVLLWNGEMLNFENNVDDKSDTQFIFNQLVNCNGDHELIYRVIGGIQGPYAFVYWDDKTSCLFFGRDVIGRRSLCWKKTDELFELNLSSVCGPDDGGWEEIPANGIYKVQLINTKFELKLVQWERDVAGTLSGKAETIPSPINTTFNDQLPVDEDLTTLDVDEETINQFISILSKSIETRVTKFNQLCQNCIDNLYQKCNHSSIGILFSGGLDSTVLALLSDRFIPSSQSIDLINVAFSADAPDRLTGLEAYKELKTLRPDRCWNFVTIDVKSEDLKLARQQHIKHLIKPLNTVLDDSIACAIWFAVKGDGICNGTSEYHSPSRVVLLGMGADEQLAGYSRHRSAFQREGWKGLIAEVRNDLTRISIRNLGRDDRIISDHGKESRLPYLDENVINYLNSLPIWKKVNLTLERGKGDKILLRLVALKLGLVKVSAYPKRAIQFGSRIAHLEKKGEKGNDLCKRLDHIS